MLDPFTPSAGFTHVVGFPEEVGTESIHDRIKAQTTMIDSIDIDVVVGTKKCCPLHVRVDASILYMQ